MLVYNTHIQRKKRAAVVVRTSPETGHEVGSGAFIHRPAGLLILICSMKVSTHAEGEVGLAETL